MKNLKVIAIFIFLCIPIMACGQNSSSNNNNQLVENMIVHFSEQQANSLFSQLQQFDNQPHYEITINTRNSYDVLVNDLLIAHDFGRIMQQRSFFINWRILRSGKQRLQIRLYPQFVNGEQLETLTNDDFLEITVSRFYWSNTGIENEQTVFRYELNRYDINGYKIDFSEKTEWIIDLEFYAQVPFELTGWTNGIVFNKKDSVRLRQKLSDIYRQEIDDIINHRFDLIRSRSVMQSFEVGQSVYDTKASLLKALQEGDDEFRAVEFNFLPLENYDIFFYGDGRVITLRRIDDEFRGSSPMIRRFVNEQGVARRRITSMFFYQPKGSDKLVRIR